MVDLAQLERAAEGQPAEHHIALSVSLVREITAELKRGAAARAQLAANVAIGGICAGMAQ